MNSAALNNTVATSLSKIISVIVVPIVTVVFAAAVVYFVWGAAGLILNKDDAEKRTTAEWHILYGVIGMFIMISAYGIIRLIANSIGVASPV